MQAPLRWQQAAQLQEGQALRGALIQPAQQRDGHPDGDHDPRPRGRRLQCLFGFPHLQIWSVPAHYRGVPGRTRHQDPGMGSGGGGQVLVGGQQLERGLGRPRLLQNTQGGQPLRYRGKRRCRGTKVVIVTSYSFC